MYVCIDTLPLDRQRTRDVGAPPAAVEDSRWFLRAVERVSGEDDDSLKRVARVVYIQNTPSIVRIGLKKNVRVTSREGNTKREPF